MGYNRYSSRFTWTKISPDLMNRLDRYIAAHNKIEGRNDKRVVIITQALEQFLDREEHAIFTQV